MMLKQGGETVIPENKGAEVFKKNNIDKYTTGCHLAISEYRAII